jgi:FdhD protein
LSTKVKLQRLDLDQRVVSEIDDTVASDKAISIYINDEHYRTFIATPTMVEELVVGHLLNEGIIRSLYDVKRIGVEPLDVSVELQKEVDLDMINRSKINLISIACGSATTPFTNGRPEYPRIESDVHVEAEEVWVMIKELNLKSEIYKETGGTHSAMLCTANGQVICFAEDVGRYNAVDKVVGAGILSEAEFDKCVLFSSGRQSSEMVLKAARSGIPILASVSGPLESGIAVARATGITLICFVRGRRMNIYSHPERVTLIM